MTNFRITESGCRCGGAVASSSRTCNNIVVSIPPKLSDAAIYSQIEQLSLGNPPDWNSPDITTNNDIPFTLLSIVTVVVHNLSPTVPACNVLVHTYTSPYGIGMPQTYLSTQKVAVLGPASSVNLSFPLPQNILKAGPLVGFFVVIEHSHDLKQINNTGCQVISGHDTATVGKNYSVQIPVCNNTGSSVQMKFSVMPNSVIASVTPATYNFSAFEQTNIQLNVTVPAALVGSPANIISQDISVMAQAVPSGQLVGGAAEILFINS